MGWLQSLAAEFPITLANGTVWLSIGQGIALGAVCLLFGVWLARFVGLLGADAPAGETFGVGLASGLVVLTSWLGGHRLWRPQLLHSGRRWIRRRSRIGGRST